MTCSWYWILAILVVQKAQAGRYPNLLYPTKQRPEELTLPRDPGSEERYASTSDLQKHPAEYKEG